jgi:hypothetical protein
MPEKAKEVGMTSRILRLVNGLLALYGIAWGFRELL